MGATGLFKLGLQLSSHVAAMRKVAADPPSLPQPSTVRPLIKSSPRPGANLTQLAAAKSKIAPSIKPVADPPMRAKGPGTMVPDKFQHHLNFQPNASAQDKAKALQGDYGYHTSLKDNIARWYENVPGGIDKAMRDAQFAQVTNDYTRSINRNMYHKWDTRNIEQKIPVHVTTGSTPVTPGGATGFSWADMANALPDRQVWVRHQDGTPFPQSTLEHELTHSAVGSR